MQIFELDSLMMMMEKDDLLTCWLSPQVKRKRQAKGSDSGKRQRKLEGVFLQLTYSSQFYSQA